MEQIPTILGIAVVMFASTNVDDILLLSVFFSDPGFSPRQVIAGQFIGMAALTAASGACALLAFAVPAGWIGLLGLAPLALGVHALWKLRRGAEDEEDEGKTRPAGSRFKALAVAAVTIANGGDNLGVYIPVFSSSPRRIPIYIAVFAVMTGVWCALGYSFVNNALLGARVRRLGRVALPFVLIGLGLWILSHALVLVRA